MPIIFASMLSKSVAVVSSRHEKSDGDRVDIELATDIPVTNHQVMESV